MGNYYENTGLHFNKYFNVIANTNGNVKQLRDSFMAKVVNTVPKVPAIESDVPRVGGFFWGDRSDGSGDSKGNHMGVVIKVDEENQRY